jgi:hypothetical protein
MYDEGVGCFVLCYAMCLYERFALCFILSALDKRLFQRGVTSAIGGFFDEKRGLDPCFPFFSPCILMCDPVLPLARGWRVSGVCLCL